MVRLTCSSPLHGPALPSGQPCWTSHLKVNATSKSWVIFPSTILFLIKTSSRHLIMDFFSLNTLGVGNSGSENHCFTQWKSFQYLLDFLWKLFTCDQHNTIGSVNSNNKMEHVINLCVNYIVLFVLCLCEFIF